MNSKQEEFILQNRGRYSNSELASKLNLKEREIKRFLQRQQIKKKSAPEVPQPPEAPPRSLPWVFPLLFILGLLIYSNTFGAEFHYDDFHNIVENPAVHNLFQPQLVWQSHKDRFLTYLSFALNYHFGKTNVWGYHLINILIHIATSFSVYLFVILLFRTPRLATQRLNSNRIALAAALLFLCHPIQIQAVTYIVQRAASLATLFYVSACILYLRARLKPTSISYWNAVTVTAAAMFTKQTAFTLPLALILLEYLFFPSHSYYSFMKRVRFLLPFLATMAIPLWVRSSWAAEATARGEVAQFAETGEITPFSYFSTQFSVIVTYIRLVLWPTGFSIYHGFPILGLLEPRTLLSLALLLLIALSGFLIRKKQPWIAFGIFWFFLTLSVESSFLPIHHLIFEHRMYLPMAGVCLTFATLLSQVLKNQKIFATLLTILVITLSTLTYRRNFVWRTSKSLWEDTESKYNMINSKRKIFFSANGRKAIEQKSEDKPFSESSEWKYDGQ